HPDLNKEESSRHFIDYFIDTNALDATDAMLIESRRSLLARMSIPVEQQDQEIRGRLPVNDLHQCGCEVRHIALRHLLYGGETEAELELAERVTQIKTKFWIDKEEQNDLFKAAELVMKMVDDRKLLAEESMKTACPVAPTKK